MVVYPTRVTISLAKVGKGNSKEIKHSWENDERFVSDVRGKRDSG